MGRIRYISLGCRGVTLAKKGKERMGELSEKETGIGRALTSSLRGGNIVHQKPTGIWGPGEGMFVNPGECQTLAEKGGKRFEKRRKSVTLFTGRC